MLGLHLPCQQQVLQVWGNECVPGDWETLKPPEPLFFLFIFCLSAPEEDLAKSEQEKEELLVQEEKAERLEKLRAQIASEIEAEEERMRWEALLPFLAICRVGLGGKGRAGPSPTAQCGS